MRSDFVKHMMACVYFLCYCECFQMMTMTTHTHTHLFLSQFRKGLENENLMYNIRRKNLSWRFFIKPENNSHSQPFKFCIDWKSNIRTKQAFNKLNAFFVDEVCWCFKQTITNIDQGNEIFVFTIKLISSKQVRQCRSLNRSFFSTLQVSVQKPSFKITNRFGLSFEGKLKLHN